MSTKFIDDFSEKLFKDEDILNFLNKAYDDRIEAPLIFSNVLEAAKVAIQNKYLTYKNILRHLERLDNSDDFLMDKCETFNPYAFFEAIDELKKNIVKNNKEPTEINFKNNIFDEFNLSKIKGHLESLKPYLDTYKKQNPSTPIECSFKFMLEHIDRHLKEVNHE